MMTIAEQVSNHFDMHLDDFIHEFYEHLDGYEELTIKDVSDGIVEGIKKWASEIDADAVYKQLTESNDDLADNYDYESDEEPNQPSEQNGIAF